MFSPLPTFLTNLNKIDMRNESWIIIDLQTKSALYGLNSITFRFSSREVAKEVATKLFKDETCYIVVMVIEQI